jgi:hypothetical protein
MNKTKSYLHIFFKIFKLTNHYFKSSLFICNSWIDRVDSLYFLTKEDSHQPNWRRVHPFPSPVPPLLRPMSPHRRAVSRFLPIKPRWARCLHFIFRQRFIRSPPLSSWNWSIESASSPQSTLPNRPAHTLHCYKKIISTLLTLPITQLRLYFASSLARAPSTTPSELHPPSSFPFTVVPHPPSLRITTTTVMN